MLERELAKLAGENWQVNWLECLSFYTFNKYFQSNLEIAPVPTAVMARSATSFFQAPQSPVLGQNSAQEASQATADATMAHIEQVRLLILGMDQRLQSREEKLNKTIEKAETEGMKFEGMRKDVMAAKSWRNE